MALFQVRGSNSTASIEAHSGAQADTGSQRTVSGIFEKLSSLGNTPDMSEQVVKENLDLLRCVEAALELQSDPKTSLGRRLAECRDALQTLVEDLAQGPGQGGSLDQLRARVTRQQEAMVLLDRLSQVLEGREGSCFGEAPSAQVMRFPGPRGQAVLHRVIEYDVPVGPGRSVMSHLKDLLSDDQIQHLADSWGHRCDLNATLTSEGPITLFIDSGSQRRSAFLPFLSSQLRDLREVGYDFADDGLATLMCARVVNHARKLGLDLTAQPQEIKDKQPYHFGRLSGDEQHMLTRLLTGSVNTRSGALYIDEQGRLTAQPISKKGEMEAWALAMASQ